MNWDTEIWAPCRLGEAFTLRDLGHEKEQYLYAIKADWMGHHGDAMSVRCANDLEKTTPHNVRLGAGPRPWANCWTYEAKIKITPPAWCWDMQDDTMFGLDFKPKKNGTRRKVKLNMVQIYEGRPVYCIAVEMPNGNEWQYLDSIPVLDPYFAPIWPETVTKATVQEQTGPEAEQTTEKTEQTPDSGKSTDVAILPPLENCPERDTAADPATAATYAVGGIIPGPCLELGADPGELIAPAEQVRRVMTTSNTADPVAAYIAQADEDAPACWTGAESRPPGTCFGGYTPVLKRPFYYFWFEDQNTGGIEP